jgi:RNA processing factor Prp31
MIQVHPLKNFIQEVTLLSINKLQAQGKNISESEANINELYSLEFPELSKNNHVQKAKSGIIVILSPSPLSF